MLATVGHDDDPSNVLGTSPDGIVWTPRVSSGTGLNVVQWFGNSFITLGYNSGGTGGLILTSSDGSVWTSRTSGTTSALRSTAFTGNLYVIVGSNGTILTSPLDPTGTIPRAKNMKSSKIFMKHSNTVFSYTLPSSEFVEFGIYSMSGKKAALLEKGYKAAGEHNARFNTDALPVGMYVYRFRAGSFEESGRVMVTKK